ALPLPRWPVNSGLNAGLEIPATDEVSLHLGVDVDYRTMHYQASETDIQVRELEQSVSLGLSVSLK
ncbi:MAG: hypothetical protein QGG40_18600, partial [Myxococcota bacterium]|nr:hypothetical protein [Myxococcota bacterium]